ncbi:hypothetical protein EPO34_03725 [Patescibacteria group bacterium]|nr:MAG: hypothetical protein EPO34_03725 [Patescibacteria group bacterium]
MNPSLIADLKKAGLSDKASAVYAAVLEAGLAYPSKIAQTTKLNRSTVYNVLETLRLDGLVTEIERNKKLCYQVEDPARLKGYAKKQIALAEEQYAFAQKIMPELEGLLSQTPNKPRVRFFEGIEGVIAVYEEHVNQPQPYEMLAYSNVEDLMKVLPPKFVERYVERKEKLGITTRAIFPDTPFSRSYNKNVYDEVAKKFFVQARYVPAESFPYNAEITVFGKNGVSIINFHENVLIGIIIEDPTIAGMMRMAFDLAWAGAKT